jgi:hypothetical protein
MIRIATAGLRVTDLLINPNRGQLFDVACVIDSPEDVRLLGVPVAVKGTGVECDYLFVADRESARPIPHRTFLLDTGDVLGALFDGASETRSTMSLLEGPLFLVSAPFPVPPLIDNARTRGDAEIIEAYAPLHRKWMIEASFGVMLQKAVEFLAAGDVRIVRDVVWIDGVPGPCRLGDGPAACRDQEKAGVPVSCPYITN